MKLRLAWVALLAALVAPSAWFAWQNRDLPHLGVQHDDAVYFVSAKSLADGGGYRIPSLPGEPAQTKYPPGYPLLLSLAWRFGGEFPENLKTAALVNWLALPLLGLLVLQFGRLAGFGGWRRILVTALVALNPYVIYFGATLLSEHLFTCLLLASLACGWKAKGSGSAKWVVGAGVAAGAAYLVRTAGIALVAAQLLLLMKDRRWRQTGLYLAGVLPFFGGWAIWSRAHQPPGTDLVTLYYTNYLGYHFYNVGWSDLPALIWKNADSFFYGLGALFLPKVIYLGPVKILTEVLAIAACAGIYRLRSNALVAEYGLFGGFYALLLIGWHFPPTERFVLPLFPLALAGLIAEMSHLASMIAKAFRGPQASQHFAAGILAVPVAAILGGGLVLQQMVVYRLMPAMMTAERDRLADDRQNFAWIREHIPLEATFLTDRDPVLYLYTGRKSVNLLMPPRDWYRGAAVKPFDELWSFAREQRLSHAYFHQEDFRRELSDEDHATVMHSFNNNKHLRAIQRAGAGTTYELRP